MRKEIILKVIIDEKNIGTVIQKIGFDTSISSSFEVTGILQKVLDDEKAKLNLRTTSDYSIKENNVNTKKENEEFFLV